MLLFAILAIAIKQFPEFVAAGFKGHGFILTH
jgi:hypothetical protein